MTVAQDFVTKDRSDIRAVSAWVKEFGEEHYHLFTPNTESVRQAAALLSSPHEETVQTATPVEQLLEETLGIILLIKLGNEKIAWSIATDQAEAESLLQTFRTPDFTQARQKLGIDIHWVLLINPEILFTQGDLYEAHLNVLELDEQPDCVILRL
jgi:hypothetical protein